MTKKWMIKATVLTVASAAFVLVYVYAQRIINKNPVVTNEKVKTLAEDETAIEDIGQPTGEDPWSEMDKLVAAYYTPQPNTGISYQGMVKLIDDNGIKEKVLEEHPFEYSFFKGGYRYMLDSMEIINWKEVVLAVDYRSKLVSFSKATPQSPSTKLFDIDEFRKMMQAQHANAVVTQTANEKMLTIDSIQDPQVQAYRIYYDPQTYQINKMLIGMLRLSPLSDAEADNNVAQNKPDPEKKKEETEQEDNETGDLELDTYTYYMEIIYQKRSLLSQGNDFDPVKKFLKVNNGAMELQPAYKSFDLVNMME